MIRLLSVGVGLLAIALGPGVVMGQRVFQEYQPVEGLLRIGPEPERAIPMVDKGYTLVLPDGPPRGLILQLDGWPTTWGPEDPGPGSLADAALAHDVGMLHITTGNRLDFFFDDETIAEVAKKIERLLVDHDLRNTPVYMAGLSLGGTRALKLAIHLAQHPDAYWLRLAAVAIVDAPLDMVRMWHAEQRAARIAFNPAAADEGRWVSYLLETNLGGTPDEAQERYVAYSPYTYRALDGGNAGYLADFPIRAYHEPDVDWWIEHRRKSYYEMNSVDLAGLITELKIQDNENAQLITTHQQRGGYDDGSSPHTWSIVDNADLISWFLEHAH